MSLIGIDVGSSSVKVAAYSEDGKLLGVFRRELTPSHPAPGFWEQDPEEVWQATLDCISRLVATDALRRDPPTALAVSASGREAFPADSDGTPLGACIMAADTRGAKYEALPEGVSPSDPWSLSCGHMRQRMDPVLRLQWWRENRPDSLTRMRYFLGWHEFLTLRFCGRAVTDPSVASRFIVFDLGSGRWDRDRQRFYQFPDDLLPEILPWGSIVGGLRPDVMKETGLGPRVQVAVGGLDLTCAMLGTGVTTVGACGLASGSFENLLVPTTADPTPSLLLGGLSITPHPGNAGRAVFAISPTGTAVLNWARSLLSISLEDMEAELEASGNTPSPVLSVPYLSGAMLYWEHGRRIQGALTGLTLSTGRIDIIKAFMEGIAYDHVNTLSLLASEGIVVHGVRAMGGGTRSKWWTQLKADVTGLPIQVVSQPEPGTLGAALLAGLSLGLYPDLDKVSLAFSGTTRLVEPDRNRGDAHRDRIERYSRTVRTLLSAIYQDDDDPI